MTIRDDIKIILYKENKTLKALMEELSKRIDKPISSSTFIHKLKRGTVKYEEILQALDILGYDLVIRKRK